MSGDGTPFPQRQQYPSGNPHNSVVISMPVFTGSQRRLVADMAHLHAPTSQTALQSSPTPTPPPTQNIPLSSPLRHVGGLGNHAYPNTHSPSQSTTPVHPILNQHRDPTPPRPSLLPNSDPISPRPKRHRNAAPTPPRPMMVIALTFT